MWFLLIPPFAVLLAFAWFALRSRPDRTSEAMITVEGYRRSMAALARPIPSGAESVRVLSGRVPSSRAPAAAAEGPAAGVPVSAAAVVPTARSGVPARPDEAALPGVPDTVPVLGVGSGPATGPGSGTGAGGAAGPDTASLPDPARRADSSPA